LSSFDLRAIVASAAQRARTLPRREPERGRRRERFARAVRGRDRLDVVAEFKKASPSAGAIADLEVEAQVDAYAAAGAAAVSVLTEPTWFGGSYGELERAARAVSIPILMKDFVVDPAQVRHAAALGASAVLLIVRCLSKGQLEELVGACGDYGLDAVVECHDRAEVDAALRFESVVLGVNNRDLDTLAVERSVAPALLADVPRDRIAIAESGYETAGDVEAVRGLADAVLVGSALMRHPDPGELIEALRG